MVRISREMRFQLVGNTSLEFMVLAANVHNNKVTFTIPVGRVDKAEKNVKIFLECGASHGYSLGYYKLF